MYVNNQILSPQNCKPIIAQVQDPVLGTWMLTNKEFFLKPEDFMRYLGQADVLEESLQLPAPAIWRLNPLSKKWESFYTGKQLFSALLPKGFYVSRLAHQFVPHGHELMEIPESLSFIEEQLTVAYEQNATLKTTINNKEKERKQILKEKIKILESKKKKAEENKLRAWLRDEIVVIMDGQHLHGRIDSSMVGSASGGLIHRMVHEFTNDIASLFLSKSQRVVNAVIMDIGLSVGISDCVSPCDAQVQQLLTRVLPDIQNHSLLQKTSEDSELILQAKEQTTCNMLQDLRKTVGGLIQASLNQEKFLYQRNRLMAAVESGSKGNTINIAQILGCLGQIIVEGKRPQDETRGRNLPHIPKHSNDLRGSGMVRNNFANGLDAIECYTHALGGREGLVHTSVNTQETGYTNRKLVKSMESTGVKLDMSVRDSGDNILEMLYGSDGFDALWLMKLQLPSILFSDDQLSNYYSSIPLLENPEVWPENSSIRNLVQTSRKNKKIKEEWEEEKKALEVEYSLIKQDRDLLRKQQLVYPGDKCSTDIMVPVDVPGLIERYAMQQNKTFHSLPPTYLKPSELVFYVQQTIQNLYSHFPGYYNRITHWEAFLRACFSSKNILVRYKLTKESVTKILFEIEKRFVRALVSPGEMVGVVAAQSMGELLTQGTLNVFHTAGVGSALGSQISSLQTYINLGHTPSNPSMTIYLNEQASLFMPKEWTRPESSELSDLQIAEYLQKRLIVRSLQDFLFEEEEEKKEQKEENKEKEQDEQILYEPTPWEKITCLKREEEGKEEQEGKDSEWLLPFMKSMNANHFKNFSPYVIRYVIDLKRLKEYQVSWPTFLRKMKEFWSGNNSSYFHFIHSPIGLYNGKVVLRIYVSTKSHIHKQFSANKDVGNDEFKLMDCLASHMKKKIVISGLNGITGTNLDKQAQTFTDPVTGELKKKEEWCIITTGSNLSDALGLPWVDSYRSTTNHIHEICEIFGIHAAGNALQRGITLNYSMNNASVEKRHINILVRTMVHRGYIVPLRRHGINQLSDVGPLQKASFEETTLILNEAAKHADVDPLAGSTENLLVANPGPLGTGLVDSYLKPIEPSATLIKENEERLMDAILPDVTPMDLAVMVYNTGQDHCANYVHTEREQQVNFIDADQYLHNKWKVTYKSSNIEPLLGLSSSFSSQDELNMEQGEEEDKEEETEEEQEEENEEDNLFRNYISDEQFLSTISTSRGSLYPLVSTKRTPTPSVKPPKPPKLPKPPKPPKIPAPRLGNPNPYPTNKTPVHLYIKQKEKEDSTKKKDSYLWNDLDLIDLNSEEYQRAEQVHFEPIFIM